MSEHSEAFEDGRWAKRHGDVLSDNPHVEGSAQHTDWLAGFNHREPAITIDRVTVKAAPGEQPIYSRMGYIITADGSIYALMRQWWHGAVIAILFPEEVEKHGIGVPNGDPADLNVFAYQRFEFDVCRKIPVIRIAIGAMLGTTHFSKGDAPATAEQIVAVQACAKALGYSGRDKINTERGELTVAQIIERLRESGSFEPGAEGACEA